MKMVKGNRDWILLKDKYVDDFLNSLFDSGYILCSHHLQNQMKEDFWHVTYPKPNDQWNCYIKKKNLFHYELYANWLPFYDVEVEFIGF